MDTLTIGALVLCITNAIFAALWLAQRRTIAALHAERDQSAQRRVAELRQARAENIVAGYKLAQGDIYVAVVKAENQGNDILGAVRQTMPPTLLDQAEKRVNWIQV